MSERSPNYPNVKCTTHDSEAPGYAICRCIVERGQLVAKVGPPTAEELGVIVCARNPHSKNEWLLICAECAAERGFTTRN